MLSQDQPLDAFQDYWIAQVVEAHEIAQPLGEDKTIIIDGEELEKGDIYIKLQWFTFKESTQTLGRRYVKEDFNEPKIFADYGAI
jgi:hypothetical protein